jgi:adenine-specific DNA methylase
MTKKLIETTFPIMEISRLAIPERSSYKPIYQISKWFARRSSSIFRAILLGCKLDPSENLMKHFYGTEDTLNKLVVLDPFMGGGTSIIEALRLGMNCIGVDINPVAWFITKTESTMVDILELQKLITTCTEVLETKIKKWYKTSCPECKNPADIIYTHWVKLLPCPTCRTIIPLFRNFIVGYLANEPFLLCPSCYMVFCSKKPIDSEVKCPRCDAQFNTKNGYSKGRKKIECPECRDSFQLLSAIQSEKAPLESKPYAIEGYCSHCANERKADSKLVKSNYKFIKMVSNEDLSLYEKAESHWSTYSNQYLWPQEKIPLGETTKVLLNHNYTKWSDLFNSRQLLALGIIMNYISNIEDVTHQELLLAAFLNLLNHNNRFTRYSPKGQKVEGIFSRHDFHPLSTYAENNVWGTKYGRGTWIKCLSRLLKGKEYNFQPYNFEYYSDKDNTIKRRRIIVGKIDGNEHKGEIRDFLKDNNNVLLLCKDSAKIPETFPEVDLLITDPPYADNVNYSELSDFLYVWIRLILRRKYDFFSLTETPKLGEAIETKNRDTDYYQKISNIFSKCRRYLKPGGLFVFTFHHSNPDTWLKLSAVIEDSGFNVVKTHTIQSEAMNVLNIQNKKAISYDLIIVCRPMLEDGCEKISFSKFVKRLEKRYFDKIAYYTELGLGIHKNNRIVIFFGAYFELFSLYKLIDRSTPVSRERLWKTCKDLLENLESP